MVLYDIHTHCLKTQEELCEVRRILNTYPEEFCSYANLDDIWFSCGVHPWYSSDSDQQLELLKKLMVQDRVVAIGEVGLDKLQGPNIDTQIRVFRKQIELAMNVQKPLIIHCVKAWEELIALYKEYKTNIPWIIHGYRGNVEQTRQLSKLGFKFSIGAKFNSEALAHIPKDSMFCETDMSDISICKIYISICKVLDMSFDDFACQMEDNMACHFNNIAK